MAKRSYGPQVVVAVTRWPWGLVRHVQVVMAKCSYGPQVVMAVTRWPWGLVRHVKEVMAPRVVVLVMAY